ncbi:hypothetical protein [Sporohalobacter salinus]|uniref:hypothetical protein n=1 Tax=Sporohalobacter salinus TaxID=1494606 RepID=UPI00195F63CB|nr:hypothetical protein [Sporohalobacter salinus]MBM7624275.1 hypothetical protein [Sporohalobacter salinus]
MNANRISYNLNGHGLISTYVYPYANELYNFLATLNFDAKFHYTNQLGALTDSLHGAHYTRYEYIILQWHLIHELKSTVEGLGLGSKKDDFGEVEYIGEKPTVGELFQCLSILANMGHFPDTFAASKVWIDLLKQNKAKVRSGLKNGLNNQETKDILDEMIEDFDIYNIHLINAIFLLNRYTNYKDKEGLLKLSIKLLLDYINKKESNLKRYWDIYSVIRKLSYLLLDSTYAPLPFKLELSSVVVNLKQIFSGLSNNAKTLKSTIEQINILLQDSLYLSGNSMITSTNKAIELKKKFNKYEDEHTFKNVSVIRKLLEPKSKDSNKLVNIFNNYKEHTFPEVNWDSNNCLDLVYSNVNNYKDLFPEDLISWEEKIREKCGRRTCIVSGFKNPKGNIFKIAFALKNNRKYENKLNSCMNFISETIKLDYNLNKTNYPNDNFYENKKSVINYALKTVFGWDLNFKLSTVKLQNTILKPYFSDRGSKKIAEKVQKYIEKADGFLSDDELNEIRMVNELLLDLDYQGYMIVFGGSTEVWKKTSSTPLAEFDGIIILPNKKDGAFLIVIEAKNMCNGANVAENQLNSRMENLSSDNIKYELKRIDNKAAFSEIKLS